MTCLASSDADIYVANVERAADKIVGSSFLSPLETTDDVWL